jgi:hypothetical protein
MAGDWIKIEHWTPDKPEVFRIAELLGIDPDAVTGKLLRIWIWADQQTIDGNATSVTKTLLDRLCSVTGFADALIQAGWLLQDDQGLRFVNFDRHNGETAKLRALNAKRQAKYKASSKVRNVGNAKGDAPVTEQSRSGNDAGVISALPKEEKRREEKDTASAVSVAVATRRPKRGPFVPPTVEDVAAYVAEINAGIDPSHFVDHYTARDWVLNNGRKVVDWKACVRTWRKNDADRRFGNANQTGVLATSSNKPLGGIAGHEQARQDANRDAIAGFLQRRRLREGNVGADKPEKNCGVDGRASGRLALRLEEVPGEGAESGGRGTGGVGHAVPGTGGPVLTVPAENASGVLPESG